MPALMSAHHKTRIHHLGMSAVYRIAADEGCDPSDVIALLGTTTISGPKGIGSIHSVSAADSPFTRLKEINQSDIGMPISQPSQPVSPPVPAVQTGEEVNSSSLGSSPVEPISSSAPNGDEMAHGRDSLSHAAPTSLPGAESAVDQAPIRGRKPTTRDKIVAVHAEHPDWPSKLIAQHLNISEDAVRATASRRSLKLVSWWDYERALKAGTRQALASAVAKPQGAVEPPAEPQVQPPPQQPPATTPAPPKRVTIADKINAHLADHPDATAREIADATGESINSVTYAALSKGITLRKNTPEETREAHAKAMAVRAGIDLPLAPPVVMQMRSEPTGRFYLRDKTTLLYVHQSLSPAPTGDGPLMTDDRKRAWYDNLKRYRGARGKWPQIAAMRKEAASK